MEKVLLREVFPKKHYVRFDRGSTERADGHLITQDGCLQRGQGTEGRDCGVASARRGLGARPRVTFASAAGYVV